VKKQYTHINKQNLTQLAQTFFTQKGGLEAILSGSSRIPGHSAAGEITVMGQYGVHYKILPGESVRRSNPGDSAY
jgi:hypothetical protein